MINKAIIVGRITADPELRQTKSGTSVTSFTVACNRSYFSNGERTADFISCVAWRNTAEFVAKYFRKGAAIGIDGSIETRKYTDKDGNQKIAFNVRVNNATFVGSKAKESNSVNHNGQNTMNYSGGFDDMEVDDDLPF